MKIILFPHRCSTSNKHNRVPDFENVPHLKYYSLTIMHVQIFPLFLRTFEEHLKRKIQDPRKIEHFFQVWVHRHFIFWFVSPHSTFILADKDRMRMFYINQSQIKVHRVHQNSRILKIQAVLAEKIERKVDVKSARISKSVLPINVD